jgi:hypothetical protein
LKIKCVHSRVNVNILASTSVPIRLRTEQMPNLALPDTKRVQETQVQMLERGSDANKKLRSKCLYMNTHKARDSDANKKRRSRCLNMIYTQSTGFRS